MSVKCINASMHNNAINIINTWYELISSARATVAMNA